MVADGVGDVVGPHFGGGMGEFHVGWFGGGGPRVGGVPRGADGDGDGGGRLGERGVVVLMDDGVGEAGGDVGGGGDLPAVAGGGVHGRGLSGAELGGVELPVLGGSGLVGGFGETGDEEVGFGVLAAVVVLHDGGDGISFDGLGMVKESASK